MTNTLAAKLAAASLRVGALATDKTNTQQNYNYISADKILARAGEALAQQGVVIIPAVTDETMVRHEGVDKYGKTQVRYDALVTFAMQITDGETALEYPWRGRGSDYAVPDKALYKAITSGHKYFLMKLLNIGVGNEDSEHDPQPEAEPERGRSMTTDARAPYKAQPAVSVDSAPPIDPNGLDDPFTDPNAGAQAERASDSTLKRLHALGAQVYGKEWDGKRHEIIGALTAGRTHSSKDLTEAEARRMCAGMEAKRAMQQQPDAQLRREVA